MGGPYNIPRNYKGESKILFIFSTKAFLWTGGGVFVGLVLNFILSKIIGIPKIGTVLIVIFGVLGFIVGTFKVPEIAGFKFTQKVGGEEIDKVFFRWIKFKKNGKKIYIYKEEEQKDVK